MDADKVMVMEEGKVVEYDSPRALLEQGGAQSHFAHVVQTSFRVDVEQVLRKQERRVAAAGGQ